MQKLFIGWSVLSAVVLLSGIVWLLAGGEVSDKHQPWSKFTASD